MTVEDSDRRWLSAAIELSRRAPRTRTSYAVGAIVVDPAGTELARGFTGEGDPRNHAEEAALAKLGRGQPYPVASGPGRPAGGGVDLRHATLFSSLEPCTVRKSRPGTCTDLILAAGVRRVVFALREPPLFADCHGVELLRAGGAEVVEIADLGPLVRDVNAHVLGARPADDRS